MLYVKASLSITGTLALVALVGCSKSQSKPTGGPRPSQVSQDAHSHDGWWCDEHGIPEDICALCNSDVAAELKAKGDWCQKHDRPDSQCFACHPELEGKFAARYEAKYGKKPPKPEREATESDAPKPDA